MMRWIKKVFKGIGLFLGLFIFLLLTNLASEKWIFPWLAHFSALKRFSFLQTFNEKTTIINRTEQVLVKEENVFSSIGEKLYPAIARIIVISSGNEKSTINIVQEERLFSRGGVMVTNDGWVVSLADQATGEYFLKNKNLEYKVLVDGAVYSAVFAGYDQYSQLLFYKINQSGNWLVPTWGDSENFSAGEKIGLLNLSETGQPEIRTMTIQTVAYNFSLLNSDLSSSEKIEGVWLLENSNKLESKFFGNPIIDADGRVVGIFGTLEKNGQVTNFVLPIKSLEKTINKFIKNEKRERPFLGVYYLSINRVMALENGLPVNSGALIYSFSGQQGLAVLKNSPADKAGLKIRDIIIDFDGKRISNNQPLSLLLSEKNIGDRVKIKILRAGEEKELEVVLE